MISTPIHMLPIGRLCEGSIQDNPTGEDHDSAWLRVKVIHVDYLLAWCALMPYIYSSTKSKQDYIGQLAANLSCSYYYANANRSSVMRDMGFEIKVLSVVRYSNTVREYVPALRLYPKAWAAMKEDILREQEQDT